MIYNLSKKKSKDYFYETCKVWRINIPNNIKENDTINLTENLKFTFSEIIDNISNNGYIKGFEELLNQRFDPIFRGQLSIATNSKAINIKINRRDKEEEKKGPARIYPIEEELVNDILVNIQDFLNVNLKDDSSLESLTRKYRIILIFSINLIESFIYKHLIIYKEHEELKDKVSEIEALRRMPDKIIRFYLILDNELSDLKKSDEYCKFMELNRKRNDIIHCHDPFFAYGLDDMIKDINKIKIGIGGLMKRLRNSHNLPTPFFVSKITNLPKFTK